MSLNNLIVPEFSLGEKKARELIKEGEIRATLTKIYDLGYQYNTKGGQPIDCKKDIVRDGKGKPVLDEDGNVKERYIGMQVNGKSVQRKLKFTFEVDQQVKEGAFKGDNLVISTNNMSFTFGDRATLPKFVRAVSGSELHAGFNLTDLIGTPVVLTIVHNTVANGTTYANLALKDYAPVVRQLKEGEEPLKPKNEVGKEAKTPKFIQTMIDNQIPVDIVAEHNPGYDFG